MQGEMTSQGTHGVERGEYELNSPEQQGVRIEREGKKEGRGGVFIYPHPAMPRGTVFFCSFFFNVLRHAGGYVWRCYCGLSFYN